MKSPENPWPSDQVAGGRLGGLLGRRLLAGRLLGRRLGGRFLLGRLLRGLLGRGFLGSGILGGLLAEEIYGKCDGKWKNALSSLWEGSWPCERSLKA